ncbi:hypothetical protein GCM10007242_27850 [Pigmentiphaga litoralis]|uniref:hypothetical protein n=1 Tax=Pigmentiphaga litoralis TaxID=516702 RepID=UPI00167796B0|nr:hypothetical protein [Pigmentiphaga litoralis]GGX19414.1 hypothetical protein GCM10007242_27850 [Pigmentiphaga litoralis]
MEDSSQPDASQNVDFQALLSELASLQPRKSKQREEQFAQWYPGIAHAIARNVPQKDILVFLKRHGLNLHAKSYRELLDAEQKRRSDRNIHMGCAHCGADLPPSRQVYELTE